MTYNRPYETTTALREQLYDRLGRVLAVADREGKRLVPLATSLSGSAIEDRYHERTRIQDRVVGDEFECVRHCAGTHIHFEQLPGREVDQLNVLTAADPALALVNSSPYFQGRRLSAGARSEIYRWKAYDSLPHQGQLWPYAEDSETWATRLERRYEEFVSDSTRPTVARRRGCYENIYLWGIPPPSMAAIDLDGVTKTFDDVEALRGVDMKVEEGEIFGFLGPNGAGKTTTIDVLLDFVRPTDGTATVLGRDVREESRAIRERTGVLPEGFDVYGRLTGRQHFEFVREAKDADADPDAVRERVGLDAEDFERKAGGYSKGMKQRLVLGMALVGEPDLLILDEPSTGLDPNGARRMREIVREERDRGATVFFSSHILGQVESVCDRVAILQQGEIVAVDTVEGLRDSMGAETVLTVTLAQPVEGVVGAAESVDGVESARTSGEQVVVQCAGDVKMDVLTAVEAAGGDVEDFDTDEASLDELFAAYTEDNE
jgi:ABC-2 type transport system ATP-binding protein